jgi:hypothetical protein
MGSERKKSSARGTSTRVPGRQLHSGPKFVVCINNSHYPASLERNKIYRALPDDDAAKEGDLRVIDESGEDYLYPAEWFVPIQLPDKIRTSVLEAS